MWVYKITNLINQKCYIGITNNLNKRWESHKKCKDNKPLYLAFKKYGITNFEFSIIEENVSTVEELGKKRKILYKII